MVDNKDTTMLGRIIDRGIVAEATPRARAGIIGKVLSGFLLLALAVGTTLLAVWAGVNGLPAGGAGIVGVMAWLAVFSDRATTYLLSWLLDDPEVVYC